MPDIFGWDSLEAVSRIQSTARMVGITLLALLVLAEAVDFIYDRREHVLTRIAERAAADQREQEEREADQRHQSETAELQRQAVESRNALENLRKAQTPRRLTPEQTRELTDALRQFSGQKFRMTSVMGDDEGRRLGEDIVSALSAAGWDHGGPSGLVQALFSANPTGVEIRISATDIDAQRIPAAAPQIIDAMIKIGLMKERTAIRDPQVPSGEIGVVIGIKPKEPL